MFAYLPRRISRARLSVMWRAVKRKLRPDDGLLANLRLTDERGDHELDLVVGLAGAGIAVIEVKGERFDALVVDEAQEFADSWWPPLLAALADEATGAIYVFSDEGQEVYGRRGRPPVPMVPVVLDENLRNTVPIARTFGSLTPIRMRYRGGDGAPVQFVPCGTDEAVGVADDQAVALLDQGWAPQHVALLTTGHRHPEQVALQGRSAEAYWESFWDGEDIFYGHALGSKDSNDPPSCSPSTAFATRSVRRRSCTWRSPGHEISLLFAAIPS